MAKLQIYGVMAEFDNTKDLLEAAHKTRGAGYRQVDAFSPLPVEGLSVAVGFPHTKLPIIVFIGGLPFDSWPSFIPITFELTILGAAVSCFFGLIFLCGLPTPYHPVFNVPRFALASQDRFFLCIKSKDPKFEVEQVKNFLPSLNPHEVSVVPV